MSTVVRNDGATGRNGVNGSNGSSGYMDGGHGEHGIPGQHGEHGTSGGDIDVALQITNENIIIDYTLHPRPLYKETVSKGIEKLILGDTAATLTLSAGGGNGGYGGRGGNGGNGAIGISGIDATQFSCGSNGGPGGDGGDGGRGGDGGNGGNGGNINVHVREKDMDIIMILKQKEGDTRAGSGGNGGDGGIGGFGGPGGRGGNPWTWAETQQYYENGEQRNNVIYHTNPGGMNGYNGNNGYDGPGGAGGCAGIHGVFNIVVTKETGQVERYPRPYDLAVNFHFSQDTKGYNIIEPGSDVHTMVSHTNVGGMPTPSHQFIRSFVKDNKYITTKPENRVPLAKWIAPGAQVPNSKPILSHITDVNSPSYGDPYCFSGQLEHLAVVDRVNQDFSRVANVATPITIEFPVQNSVIRGGNAVLFGEEAPIVFSIWNKSALGIGQEAQTMRVLAVSLHVLPQTKGSSNGGDPVNIGDIRLRSADGKIFDDLNGLQSTIPLIHPNSKQFFAATLQFTNPDLKPYTRICIEACLHLGHVKNMSVPRNIQIRPFEIQFAESYTHNPAADYLMIVNNQTQYDEMQAWRNVVRRLGGTLCVWNLHLYGDLSLSHLRNDASTLLKDFRCKNIIYLNNVYLRDERLQVQAIEFARKRELFLAARDYGINTLVFGSSDKFDLEAELVPASTAVKFIYFKKRSNFLQTMNKLIMPGEGDMLPAPATAQGTLCGVLKRKKELWWCVLNLETRTLCFYESARQQFPDGMIYLGTFNIGVNESGTSFVIAVPGKQYTFEAPAKKEYKSKHNKYNSRPNYTLGVERWVELLKGIETSPSTLLAATGLPGEQREPSPRTTDKKCGYLKKQGRKMKFFTQYYFWLDSLQKTLSYSKSLTAKKTKAIIYLGRYAIDDLESSSERVCMFKITTPTKVLILAADDEAIKARWIASLQQLVPPSPSASIYREHSTMMRSLSFNSPPVSPTSSDIPPTLFPSASSSSINSSMSSISPPSISHTVKRIPAPSEGEPIEHNSVPRITIEGRYIFTHPKPKQLERKAKQLQKTLYQQFPNQTNIVVYDFDASRTKRGFRLFRLGTVDIFRSLDSTTPALVTAPAATEEAIHSVQVISSPATMYNLLKSLTFQKKLDVLNAEFNEHPPTDKTDLFTNQSSHIGLVMAAILSDVADEQKNFHESTWRGGLNVDKLLSRLNTLTTLLNYNFTALSALPFTDRCSSPIAAALTELVVHVENITKLHTTTRDAVLPFRRSTQVSKATSEFCKAILWQWFGSGCERGEGSIRSATNKLRKEKKESWRITVKTLEGYGYVNKKFNCEVAHNAYYFPPGLTNGGTTNCHTRVPKVLTAHEFNSYHTTSRPDGVLEGRFMVNNEIDRYASVDAFQRELGCVAGTEQQCRTTITSLQ